MKNKLLQRISVHKTSPLKLRSDLLKDICKEGHFLKNCITCKLSSKPFHKYFSWVLTRGFCAPFWVPLFQNTFLWMFSFLFILYPSIKVFKTYFLIDTCWYLLIKNLFWRVGYRLHRAFKLQSINYDQSKQSWNKTINHLQLKSTPYISWLPPFHASFFLSPLPIMLNFRGPISSKKGVAVSE